MQLLFLPGAAAPAGPEHALEAEELGVVEVPEDGEYVFESNLEAYFDDFVDDDPARFVERLYETLRADLPKYEVENKG